ncbi:bifunctional serine/threonine-protein kinase/formylglycine-generating enzyme family protein [Roseofilum casamattae]|uniref:Bifunctional serine/threonine-protein kinase/formylglycine-generating enzyme family protein n=1 Tax=Roseofilum casamattae BLCC-M143 TaxID=3022442 RepID=A0ABT7BSX1_9CYAN|nr:bifunctional serine/threonine-protein kinase/formylglycine-generating enzyme family protein [Roseofilum casamattae]MDJ1182165.1 bifunctional serine/threonine-protein kinase/formylglycine-generating enzyme family protein [Roseofilum casamattae BLCC-M143]
MGQVLASRYQIKRELGHGGFGKTFLARDRYLPGSPLCVVKQLKPQFSDRQGLKIAKRLFQAEAETLQILGKHPQIPQLLAYFNQEGEFYLVQEYIEGRDLSSEIQLDRKWSPAETIQLLLDILIPLEFVHQNQVIHRDIKPSNLIRRKSDRSIVLIDFGAVKQEFSELTKLNQTVLTVRIGTEGYMPGEQAVGRPKQASDIYALGNIAIEALTGRVASLLPRDPKTDEILWHSFAPNIDREFREVLDTMVRRDFLYRYASASDALKALRKLQLSGKTPVLTGPLQPSVETGDYSTTGTPAASSTLTSSRHANSSASNSFFRFAVVTVNRRGTIIDRQNQEAQYIRENLGEGIVLDMVFIPGGTFLMGTPDNEQGRYANEGPQHSVSISPFYTSKYPVTQAQWQQIASLAPINRNLDPNPSSFKGKNLPVEQVSWYDCEEFCARLARLTQTFYRLPSEAEWEYACRARTTTPFHFGQTLTAELANYYDKTIDTDSLMGSYHRQTAPVGRCLPNRFGLYDMHGNVWEWCADHWHDNYEGAPTDGSIWESDDESSARLLRGGSWYFSPDFCRSGLRLRNAPNYSDFNVGFRVVYSARPASDTMDTSPATRIQLE